MTDGYNDSFAYVVYSTHVRGKGRVRGKADTREGGDEKTKHNVYY
jgi:hypothetical protein